jgi:cyclopropane-fatty-acyl-phospholipid synthase
MTPPDLASPIRVTSANLGELQGTPASFRVAAMLLSRLRIGSIDVGFPDGRTFRFEGRDAGPEARIQAIDPTFARPVLSQGDIGFAETWMQRRFDTPNLTDVLEYFARNFNDAGRLAIGGAIAQAANRIKHILRPNSRTGSKRNILAHYDLGNDFYSLWLDPSMTYSSAVFEQPDQPLHLAQVVKYESMADALRLKPGDRVLEIGCGWGGFAEHVAKTREVRIDCITISDAQYAYARKRIADAGLNERVDIQLRDYRDVSGRYDAVASIEMFEAVGEQWWPTFFGKVSESLNPGGRAALQVITIDDDEFEAYRKRVDFIRTHIFPGGMLPSTQKLDEATRRAGMNFEVDATFGASYARTLNQWAERFQAAWPKISAMGFDERFRRLWLYYLAYCEAGFRTGSINVGRFVLQRG